MVGEALFRRHVREVLAHLYQPAYVLAHPLAALLVDAGLIRAPDELASFLTNVVEQLRPPGAAPHASPGWRQYRYLHLRYVECVGHRRIAEDLLISTRQACREHEAGLDALARLLWGRYAAATGPASASRTTGNGSDGRRTGPTSRAVEAELLRVGAEPPDGPISLEEVLGGALSTISRLAAARGVSFRRSLPSDLPPIVVNRLALRHVLLNLLGYLIDTAETGGLAIAAAVGEDTVDLSLLPDPSAGAVEPSGPSRDEHAGLATAIRLAEMQRLDLRLDVAPGASPRAILRLPTARARRVLLVDDNPDVGRLFRRYLAGTSYCLVHARSAESALRMTRENVPDVILLDVLLPRSDGWQFLESLRADGAAANVPVVACSVVPEESLALSLGVVEFLAKPVSQEALLSALARWCPTTEAAAPPGNPAGSARTPRRQGPLDG